MTKNSLFSSVFFSYTFFTSHLNVVNQNAFEFQLTIDKSHMIFILVVLCSNTDFLFNKLLKDNEPRLDANLNELFSDEPIIKIDFEKLLKRNEIILSNVLVESVNTDAMFLFRNVGRLEFHYSGDFRIEDILASVEKFENRDNSICLSVYANQMEKVEASMFNKMKNVRDLRLNFDQIATFDTFVSSALSTLQHLHLECNLLKCIDLNFTTGLASLIELRLSENKIASIDPAALNLLVNLQKLILNDNELSELGAGLFKKLVNLQELWLNANKIKSVDASAFTGLQSLSTLKLNDNQITSLDPATFKSLIDLEFIDLHRNQISSLDASYFEGLTKLKKLKLNHNLLVQKERLKLRSIMTASVET
jgi:Leucine-rich repeat (LRR) protein